MKIKELPQIELLGTFVRSDDIQCALTAAFDGYFLHFTTIPDAPRTGRIYAARPFADSAPFPRALSPAEIVIELRELDREVRWPPQPEGKFRKAWEVGSLIVEGVPAVIAWASWA